MKHRLLVLLGFVAASALLFRGAWAAPSDVWVGGPGDPPLFMWYLRWVPYALSHGVNPLFTDHMNFPDGVNLMWNTAVPLPALLLSPVTLTLGPTVAYNVLMTAAVALSAWCAYLLLSRYASTAAALAGAALYGFSPYIVSHATAHPNLPAAFAPPLFALLLIEILAVQRRRAFASGALLGLLAATQLLVSEEVLASSVLVAAVAVVLLCALHWEAVRPRAPHALRALAVAAVVGLVLASGPLLFQFFGAQRVESGSLWGPNLFVTDVAGVVVPTDHQQLSSPSAREITDNFTDACCPAEWNAYLGLPLLVFMVATTVVWWRRPDARFVGLLGGAMLLFSLGPHLHVNGEVLSIRLPFWLLTHAPVVKNLLAGRLTLYVFLAGAFLLAQVLDQLWTNHRRAVAVALAAVVLVPLLPRLGFPATRAHVPEFFSSGARGVPKGTVALVAPFPRDTSTSEPMLWQAAADMRYRMPAGYALGPDRSGRFSYLPEPTELSRTMERIQQTGELPDLTTVERAALEVDLRRSGVAVVIVGNMPKRPAMILFFTELLERPPERVDDVDIWFDIGP